MMRITLFLLTNIAVMLVFGIVLSFSGVKASNALELIIAAGIFGFGGAFLSLLMSKFIALSSVNGKIISHPNNETENWLLNIVQKHAQKTNISTPQVALYHAYDINAFATGYRRNASLIAVSTGLLQNMNHDEIDAVIAHEISHIANGDMVTMTLIQGIVNTFVIFISRVLAHLITRFILTNNDRENENKNSNLLVYYGISMLLELIFGVIASIITFWFSRYREFYADAGSARLVGRNKMIAALQRLKNSYEPQEANNIITFCINGYNSKALNELFMSHPPLDKRIEALRAGTYIDK